MTTDSYGRLLQQLKSAQKSSKGAPAYSLYVNRKLGRYLAAAAHKLGLTPNLVTLISGLFSFAAIAVLALALPSWTTGVIVCLGLVIGYALDSADGQLARLRGGGTAAGEWLDHFVDCAKISCLHAAVLIMLARHVDLGGTGWLLVPIGFGVVAAVSFFGMILTELLTRENRALIGAPKLAQASGSSVLRSLVKIPTDYGFLCLTFIALGAPIVFFWIYALLGLGSLGYLLLAAPKWYLDMAALRAPGRAGAEMVSPADPTVGKC